jgi:hypothetical protein
MKLKKYRLSDNFLRFYFRYMKNKLTIIQSGNYEPVSVSNLPGWQTMQGLQFENLVLKNGAFIHRALSINPEDIIVSGPYFQKKNARQRGCQIDYLIQTKYATLFVCEIKFSQNPLGSEVIEKVKEKIDRLSLPRGFSAIPVLIHISGVTEVVREADYFFASIDFSQFLHQDSLEV